VTLVEQPPAPPAPDSGDWLPVPATSSRSSWRLAARLAWREVVRRRARTALVVALIAVPSLAMTVAAVGYRTNRAVDARWGERGPADVVVDGWNSSIDGMSTEPVSTAALAAAGVPADAVVASYLFTWANIEPVVAPAPSDVAVPDAGLVWATFSDLPIADPQWRDLVKISSGRAPAGPDEVLVGPEVAKALRAGVGDQVTLARPSGTWTVVGIGRFAPEYWTELFVVNGFDHQRVNPTERRYETLIDLPDGTSPADVQRIAAELGGRTPGIELFDPWQPDQAGELTLGWVMGAMAFLAFGIVIAAAFATSARKQLLSVGQLSANGASTRLIGRMLSWQGLWSGLLGGVAGAAAGLALLPVVSERAEVYLFHRSATWVVRPLDVVIVVATATVAGTLAALVPTRALARTSVLAALAGRRPVKPVPNWLLPLGLVLGAGGTGLMALALVAGRTSSDGVAYSIAAVLGGAGIAIGTCCVSPWVVQQFARLASRLPLAGRLSLRSLARSRGRSAAVISAIAVTVAVGTAAVGGIERNINEQLDGDRYLPRDTALVINREQRVLKALGPEAFAALNTSEGEGSTIVDLPAMADVELPAEALATIERLLPGAVVEPLRMAVPPGGPTEVTGGWWPGDDAWLPIASAATFRAGGWDGDAQRAFASTGWAELVAASGPYGSATRGVPWSMLDGLPEPAPVEVPEADPTPFGQLMSAEFAAELGFDVVTLGVVVRADGPLSADQRQGLTSDLYRALHPGAYERRAPSFVEPGDAPLPTGDEAPADTYEYWSVDLQWVDDTAERALWLGRAIALAAAVVLIGLVVAIGLALAAADQRAERDVLAVVGARPTSLRRMAAWNAVTMSLIGIVIGVPVGFLPAWAVVRAASYNDASIPFPWLFVVALIAIVPSLMLVAAWAGSAVAARFGRQPTPRRIA